MKKTKEVKFAVEAIKMDETVKNSFKDARIARAKNKLKDASIAKIKNESKVEKLQRMHTMDWFQQIAETVGSVEDEQLWNQKRSLNPGTRVKD